MTDGDGTARRLDHQDDFGTLMTVTAEPEPVKHQFGVFLQFIVLSALPALILVQLYYGFPLIVMPVCLVAGVVLFTAGTHLRES